MRQRLENPIFGFTSSTITAQSVTGATLVSASTDYANLAAVVQSLKTQLIAIGLIQAS